MAQTESKIRLLFEGAERGVVAAAKKSEAAIRGLDDKNSKLAKSSAVAEKGLLGVGKAMLAIGGANSALNVIGGTVGALTQLAPAALLLPGALLAGAAAMGTFKIATAGMGDALEAGLSGDMEKFAEATKDMAPEMQAAAKAVVAFKPQIDGLKKSVQGAFWDDFADAVTGLGDNLLPVLTTGLTDVADQMGEVAKGAVRAAQTKFFTGAVGSILQDTAGFFREVGEGAGDVLTGIVGIGKVGATYLPRLGESIGGVAQRFREWVESVDGQARIKDLIDNAIQGFKDLGGIVTNVGSIGSSVFRGLGTSFESPLAKIRDLTAQVADFLKTAAAQDGLRALGETLRVVGDVVGRVLMAALKELAPTLVKLAPVAQEVARTLGDLLVSAIETLGPLIRGIADAFNAFPGSAAAATVAVVGFVAAIKTIKAVNAVSEFLGLGTAIGGVGDKAKAADGKVRGFAGGLGLIKGALAVGAIAAIAVEMDKVNTAAAGGAENLQGFERNLHNIVGAAGQLASGDIPGIMADIDAQVAATNETWKKGEAPVQKWAVTVGQAATDAAQSMQNFVRGLLGMPPVPPIKVDADTDPATGKVDDWVGGVSRRRGTAEFDAAPALAYEKVNGWTRLAEGTTGMARLNANPQQANGATSGWKSAADRTSGTAQLRADPSSANRTLNNLFAYWNGRTIYVNIGGSRITGATGGAVTDGAIVPHFGVGGPVRGAGSGTSDDVPAMLSNGEWVMRADEVKAAGGFSGMAAIADMLRGRSPLHASAQAAMRTPSAASTGGSAPVQVQLVAAPGADALFIAAFNKAVRTGALQLRAVA